MDGACATAKSLKPLRAESVVENPIGQMIADDWLSAKVVGRYVVLSEGVFHASSSAEI
jgi:hypothetical protein